MKEAHQVFTFPLDAKPDFVAFDPGCHLLKKLTFKQPPEMLKARLARDPDWFGRVEAAQMLCKDGSRDALDAVGKALAQGRLLGRPRGDGRGPGRERLPRGPRPARRGG